MCSELCQCGQLIRLVSQRWSVVARGRDVIPENGGKLRIILTGWQVLCLISRPASMDYNQMRLFDDEN